MDIRPACRTDLATLTRIYNHYVVHSHATFDVVPFSEAERSGWFETFDGGRYQCWAAVREGRVAGYACSMPLKAKPAYGTSVEVSVYVDAAEHGLGMGRALYEQLFGALAGQDLHRAYALIAQPNDASMKLHEAFGFRPVSRLTEVGRKFDRFWDVVWLEKALQESAR